jgi:hypothetical protein
MRFHARLLLGLCGMALALSAAAVAAPLGDDEAAAGMPPQQQSPHHHKGLFGRRHCVECQRAYAKSHDGIDIPPPPPIGPAQAPGRMVSHMVPGHMVDVETGECLTCQGKVPLQGPIVGSDGQAPGYAVVGGPGMGASPNGIGYAVVGESMEGPAPVGVARAHQPPWADPRMAANGPRPGAGPYDPAVVATGMPPAQVALTSPAADRPHIISHLLGIPKLGRARREREEKERQKHAAIAYDQPARQVNELPASMVYGTDKK